MMDSAIHWIVKINHQPDMAVVIARGTLDARPGVQAIPAVLLRQVVSLMVAVVQVIVAVAGVAVISYSRGFLAFG